MSTTINLYDFRTVIYQMWYPLKFYKKKKQNKINYIMYGDYNFFVVFLILENL